MAFSDTEKNWDSQFIWGDSPSGLVTPNPSRPPSPSTQTSTPAIAIPEHTLPKPTANFSDSTVAALSCATLITPLSVTAVTATGTTTMPQEEPTGVPDVSGIITSTRSLIGALAKACDAISQQTAQAAYLGPAVEASREIANFKAQMLEQFRRQDEYLEGMKERLSQVVRDHLNDALKTKVNGMIKRAVEVEIKDRVENRLEEDVPATVREQARLHSQHILEAKTVIYNQEAKRYNATLRNRNGREPLRPLLRPLPSPEQSPSRAATATVPPTPTIPRGPASTPIASSHRNGAWSSSELPAPSPLFPKNFAGLMKLGLGDAVKLNKELGLLEDIQEGDDEMSPRPMDVEAYVKARKAKDDAAKARTLAASTSSSSSSSLLTPSRSSCFSPVDREFYISRLMSHIGVPFRLIPGKGTEGKSKLPRIITSF